VSGVSNASGRSRGVYRTINRTAQVDESLFGDANKTALPAPPGAASPEISAKQLRKKGASMGASPKGSEMAVVIGASELNRLRENARMLTKEEEIAERARAADAYAERMQKSAARKEKIQRMEEERKKNVQPTEFDKANRVQKNSVLEKAKELQTQDQDDVKHMNQMMLYSKIVTVRDAQIDEKRHILHENEDQEKQLDAMMEIDRLKALKTYEEREQERHEQQRNGAKVIIEQIKDRQAMRMREEDIRDQERGFVLKQIEALKQEEVEQARHKKIAGEKLLAEVHAVNSAAMKIKEDKMLAEKLEEQKIIEYRENKEQREREMEAEKIRVAAEREQETARLRAMQEKAADKASEMDALRAKRATEAAERAARTRDKAQRDKQEAMNRELADARLLQQSEKERRLGEQAKFERDEFDRIINVQMEQEGAERQRQADERDKRVNHSQELRSQIVAREEKSYQERRDFLEEGNSVRATVAADRKHLEGIKAQKIAQLKKDGVPEKYWAELSKKKISV